MNEIPRDLQVRIELAREAKDLLDNRAFNAAVGVLKQQWIGELLGDDVEISKVYELRANLIALERVMQLLRNLTTPPRGANVRQSG